MGQAERNQIFALYNRIVDVGCKGLCQEACGPIDMTHAEAQIMRRASKTRELPVFDRERSRCSYLGPDGRCQGYDVRPLVCRLFGSAENIPCPFGCRPTMTSAQADAIILRALKINENKPLYHSDPEIWALVMQAKREGLLAHHREVTHENEGQSKLEEEAQDHEV